MKVPAHVPLFALVLCLSGVALPHLGCRESVEEQASVSLSIAYPEEGQYVRERRVRVRGEARGAARVDVNGVLADVTGGRWEALVEFGEGPAVATVTAGETSVARAFVVDSRPPSLTLSSPARALVLDSALHGASIRVEGQAVDEGSGVLYVRVGEAIIDLDATGAFAVDVPLVEGLNEIEVVAVDVARNDTVTRRGLIYGPLVDPTASIDQAFTAHVLPEGLETLSAVIASFATPERVMAFVAEGFESDYVEVESVSFDPADVRVRPRQGHLEVALTVENLRVDGAFKSGQDSLEAHILLARVRVVLEVVLEATATGGLSIVVRDSTLELDERDISSNLIDDSQFLRNITATLARVFFAEYVEGFLIEELYDPDMLKRRLELLSRSFEFELAIEDITIRDTGVILVLKVRIGSEAYEGIPQVAGALNRALGPGSASSLLAPVRVTSSRTALDRIVHGGWRSGFLHQALVGDDFAGMTLPLPLTVDGLATTLDGRIRNLADSQTPAALRLRPLLPPVMAFKPGQGQTGVKMHLGELMVDFNIVHPNQPEQTVITAGVFVDLGLDLEMNGTDMALSFEVSARVEVAELPVLDIEEDRVIGILEGLVALIPEFVSQSLVVTGEADLPWVRFERPAVAIHGAANDRVTVGVDMVAVTASEQE
jgi:hypothetical protein